jgi:hypothetical protein
MIIPCSARERASLSPSWAYAKTEKQTMRNAENIFFIESVYRDKYQENSIARKPYFGSILHRVFTEIKRKITQKRDYSIIKRVRDKIFDLSNFLIHWVLVAKALKYLWFDLYLLG